MTCTKCGTALAEGSRFCGTCGNAVLSTETAAASVYGGAPPPALDLVGREIAGRYRMLAKLGEGGMGAVYRAEQISLKRKVAVKLLKPELSSEPGLVRRFNAEAELAAKLNHPNTVNIYDFGQDRDGTLFIAMEYVEGRSLRAALAAEGAMPPARALYIVAQIASSLTDAHAHGIVHRDLKPDNVMLTERGKQRDVVRVLDFGIAKLRDDGKGVEQAMTRAGDLVGTPQYMAPEQIRAEAVDGRTDIYAVGAMLYEMITGRLPFEGPTLMAILSKHLTENPEPPSRRRPELRLPAVLDALVMETLAKQPDGRPPSMERFGERIAEVAAAIGAPLGMGPMSGSSTAQVPVGAAVATPPPGAAGFAPPSPPPSGVAPGVASAPAGLGPPPGAPPMTPGRPMRPPGVPHTYPPGVMMAPPEPPPAGPASPPFAPSPYAPPGYAAPAPAPVPLPAHTPPPPAHLPYPPGPPPLATQLVPAPRGNRTVVWVLVALALAGVGVGVTLLVMNKQGGGGEVARGSGSSTHPVAGDDDPTAGDDGAGDDSDVPAPAGRIDTWKDGTTIRTNGGSWLVLPAGMVASPVAGLPPGLAVQHYVGTLDGKLVRVMLIEVPQQPGKDMAEEMIKGLMAEATSKTTGQQTVQGMNGVQATLILDGKDVDDVTPVTMEVLVLKDTSRVVMLLFGTAPENFEDLSSFRFQLFGKRFHPT